MPRASSTRSPPTLARSRSWPRRSACTDRRCSASCRHSSRSAGCADARSGRYALGTRLAALSREALDSLDLREAGAEHVRRLQRRTGNTVHLAALMDRSIVYVDKAEDESGVRMYSRIGKAVIPYCSAVGKAILANLDAAGRDAVLDGVTWERHTDRTITTREQLDRELARRRRPRLGHGRPRVRAVRELPRGADPAARSASSARSRSPPCAWSPTSTASDLPARAPRDGRRHLGRARADRMPRRAPRGIRHASRPTTEPTEPTAPPPPTTDHRPPTEQHHWRNHVQDRRHPLERAQARRAVQPRRRRQRLPLHRRLRPAGPGDRPGRRGRRRRADPPGAPQHRRGARRVRPDLRRRGEGHRAPRGPRRLRRVQRGLRGVLHRALPGAHHGRLAPGEHPRRDRRRGGDPAGADPRSRAEVRPPVEERAQRA